jgi:WD40 repeat protein
MTNSLSQDFCPYKGLQPYTEADRAFFFGRERDSEIIASNLYAAPLTVLYGESGVGKSSVLLAGVVPLLRQTPNVVVVVFRQWQDAQFASILKTEVLKAIKDTTAREADIDLSLPLDEFLVACNRILRGPIFLLFDQFEEFFLYHPPTEGAEGFDAEWARAVNRQEIDANFLLSLREDSLSRLDRFKGRIPKLMSNMLRLKHLNHEAGRAAIRKPLEKYNELLAGRPPVTVEDELVETLLYEIQAGRVMLGAGRGQVNTQSAANEAEDERIETPFLQMVLMRLWNEERAEDSHVLRLETLKKLGGAERVIRTHLDKVMEKLTGTEQDVAAQLFRFLVTPSGSKIAHTTGDLISYAEMPNERVEPVLKMLSSPEVRILRTIAPPLGQEDGTRYEIFHDVLAQAVLDWRARYNQEQKRLAAERELAEERARAKSKLHEAQQRARRLRWGAIGLTVMLVITLTAVVLFVLFLRQSNAFQQARIDNHSRQLANYSRENSDYDPDLSLLLAIESTRPSMTVYAIEALKRSLVALQTRHVLSGHGGPVRGTVFSPDGKYVATASLDNTARVWETATGNLVSVLKEHEGPVLNVSFSPNSKYVVTASWDNTARVWADWQTKTPRVVATLREPDNLFSAIFSPDGHHILLAGSGILVTWEWREDAGGQAVLQKRWPLPTGMSPVYNTAFSPDGKYFAAATEKGLIIWEWDTSTGSTQPLLLLPKYQATKVAFSHNGQYLGGRCGDSLMCIWDWTNADARNSPVQLSKSMLGIRGVAFSPDDQIVATGQEDGTILLWRWRAATPEERNQPHQLLGHVGDNSMIHALAFSPDGQFLVSASEDKTARIWMTQQLDPKELEKMTPEQLLKLAESRVTRPFTQEERKRYLEETEGH